MIAGDVTHDDAYTQARAEKQQRQQREQRRAELADKAPDLAALISDEFTLDMAYAAYEEKHRKERERQAADAANKRQVNTDWHVALATIEGNHHPEPLAYLRAAYEPAVYDYTPAELHRVADLLHDIADRWDNA